MPIDYRLKKNNNKGLDFQNFGSAYRLAKLVLALVIVETKLPTF